MKGYESFKPPEFGKEQFDKIGKALDALHVASGALSGDMRYVSCDDVLAKELLDDPEMQQQLFRLREAVADAHVMVSKSFRLLSDRLAHSQSNLLPFELGVSGTQSKKIFKKQRDQMIAERKSYFDKTAHWSMSNQFKNWIAPHAKSFLDIHKELSAYCLYEGETFQECMSHTLITQCATDIATMKTEVVRLTSAGDLRGESATYVEAAGRAVQFFRNELAPFIEAMEYREEISKKFALQNIAHLTNIAEEIR